MGLLDRFKRKQAVRLNDDEKAAAFERDDGRFDETQDEKRFAARRGSGTPRRRAQPVGNFAPHPYILLVLRFLLYGLTSLSALATAGLGIAVVHYYNSLDQVIKPAWGSLIACIVFGILTPGILYGTMMVTPFLFKHASFLDIVNQTRTEIVSLFAVAVIWVSGALALACDLRGTENCLWDGYYHYPRPDDFQSVCDLINYMVALAYTTFGLTCVQLVVLFLFTAYTLLFLDQEALTERTNDLGGRAYRARQTALAQRRAIRNAERASVSTSGPNNARPMSQYSAGTDVGAGAGGPMAGGVAASRRLPPAVGMAGGDETEERPMMSGGRHYSDEERGSRERSSRGSRGTPREEDMDPDNEGYYGLEQPTGGARLV